nr:hypothetical protein [Candidatus Freyarchaeota archaeon]
MLTPDYLLYSVLYTIIVSLLIFLVSTIFIWRFGRTRKAIMFYLSLAFIIFSIALFAAGLSDYYNLSLFSVYLLVYTNNASNVYILFSGMLDQLTFSIMEWIILIFQGKLISLIYTYTLSIILVDLANLSLYAFTLEAFAERKRRGILVYSVTFVPLFILTLMFLDSVLIYLLAFIIGLMTYVPLTYLAIRASRMVDQKVYRYGFLMIATTSIFLILFFALGFLDEILGFNIITIIIESVLVLAASIFAYVGYTLPNWFRKLAGSKIGNHLTPRNTN